MKKDKWRQNPQGYYCKTIFIPNFDFHQLRVVSHNRAPDLHVTVFSVQG